MSTPPRTPPPATAPPTAVGDSEVLDLDTFFGKHPRSRRHAPANSIAHCANSFTVDTPNGLSDTFCPKSESPFTFRRLESPDQVQRSLHVRHRVIQKRGRMKERSSRRIAITIALFCVAAAVASPAQTFNTIFTFNGFNGGSPIGPLIQSTNGNF